MTGIDSKISRVTEFRNLGKVHTIEWESRILRCKENVGN
jgi:hypothetical protein